MSPGRGRPVALGAFALTPALLLVGCSTDSTEPPVPSRSAAVATAAPDSAAEATGELRQFRRDVLLRMIQVTVHARVPLAVRSVQVRAAGFADGPVTTTDVDLPAGAVVDLATGYGRADCTVSSGTGQAVLQASDGASMREILLPLTDAGLLKRLHASECSDRELAAAVEVSVNPQFTPALRKGRPALLGTLRLRRRVDGKQVSITDFGGHIVFTVRADPQPRPPSPPPGVTPDPLLVLGPEQQSATLPFALIPTRCDPHALAENKRAGVLGVYVSLGDSPSRLTTITPDPAIQQTLRAFTVSGCRAAPA